MKKTGHWLSGFGWGFGLAMLLYSQSWKGLIFLAVFGLSYTLIVNLIFYETRKSKKETTQ